MGTGTLVSPLTNYCPPSKNIKNDKIVILLNKLQNHRNFQLAGVMIIFTCVSKKSIPKQTLTLIVKSPFQL